METFITGFPVLRKIEKIKSQSENTTSSCCAKPANATACCTPSKSAEENNGACCAQPADGGACCDK
ncbi:MAG TPA: hypothetical protein VGD17_15380 [Chitinophagaceae bacterium]